MKTATVTSIGKQFKSYGHWKITVELDNGKTFSKITTDSQAIDDWNEETDNYPMSGANFLAERLLTCDNDYEKVIFDFSA